MSAELSWDIWTIHIYSYIFSVRLTGCRVIVLPNAWCCRLMENGLERVVSHFKPHPILFCVLYTWIKYFWTNASNVSEHSEHQVGNCGYYESELYLYIPLSINDSGGPHGLLICMKYYRITEFPHRQGVFNSHHAIFSSSWFFSPSGLFLSFGVFSGRMLSAPPAGLSNSDILDSHNCATHHFQRFGVLLWKGAKIWGQKSTLTFVSISCFLLQVPWFVKLTVKRLGRYKKEVKKRSGIFIQRIHHGKLCLHVCKSRRKRSYVSTESEVTDVSAPS